MVKFLADGKTVDEEKDGKDAKKRSAAAKKAARTRKKNKGNWTKFHLKIDNKLLLFFKSQRIVFLIERYDDFNLTFLKLPSPSCQRGIFMRTISYPALLKRISKSLSSP